MTFHEATARYLKWTKQFPGDPNIPNEGLSEEHDGIWHLNNVDGPLAVVTSNGGVIAVGHFWSTYERLAEDGMCDSPGGAEYRRVLAEWIEQQPDDMEKFICRRARSALATVAFAFADRHSSVTCTITATVAARDEEEAVEEALEEVKQAIPQLNELIEHLEPDEVVWNPCGD